DPTERDTLARVFRTLHTVKGTAGFLGLLKLQAVAHAAESLLALLRSGELTFSAPIASALLATVDAIRRMLDAVEKTEQDGEASYQHLTQTLERLRSGQATSPDPEINAPELPPTRATPTPVPEAQAASAPHETTAVEPGEPRASSVADTALR